MSASYLRLEAQNLLLLMARRKTRTKHSTASAQKSWPDGMPLVSSSVFNKEINLFVTFVRAKSAVTFRNKNWAAVTGFSRHKNVDMPYCSRIAVYCCYCSLSLARTFNISN